MQKGCIYYVGRQARNLWLCTRLLEMQTFLGSFQTSEMQIVMPAAFYYFFSLRTQEFIFTTGFLYYLITGHVCFFRFFGYPATISYWKGEGLVNLLPGHHESQLPNIIPKEDKGFFFLFKKFTRKIHQNEFES